MAAPDDVGALAPAGLALEALTTANAALSRLDAHERVCEERWRTVAHALARLESGQRNLQGHLWTVAGGVILLLVSVVGYLADKLVG